MKMRVVAGVGAAVAAGVAGYSWVDRGGSDPPVVVRAEAPPFPTGITPLEDCLETWMRGTPTPVDGWTLVGVTCNLFEVWTTPEHAGSVSIVNNEVRVLSGGVPISLRMTYHDCDCNRDGLWNGLDIQAYVWQVLGG